VIGAYRDNEVDPAHPLMRRLDTIRKEGARVQEISLAPLTRDDLKRLIVDTLSCAPTRAAPLARLVHEKTGGNPFFAIQFISTLAEEALLRFDHDAARWRWELDRIHGKGYTDNVVDLMVGRLTRLPVQTQAALRQLACLGNVAKITTLSVVLGKSEGDVRSDLWDAVRLELVEHSESTSRPCPGGRLLTNIGTVARRVAPPHRKAARSTYPGGKTRRGHLRNRQSAEPRRRLDHVTQRA
jgi:predicted ATPase